MSIAMAEETGLPIAAAADKLGIHPRTLRRYISDGRLTAIRYTSQVVRISEAELLRFQDDNLKIETGTGTCYVPRPADEPAHPVRPANPAKPRVGFGG